MKNGLLVWFLFSGSLLAQGNCELVINKDSINVYKCKSVNSKYKAIQSTFYLNASFQQVKLMLLDIENLASWQYGTESALLLKRISDHEIIYYTEVDLPVADNRDFVIHMNIHQATPQEMIVTATSLPDYIPTKKNVVRVPLSKATWIIKEEKKNRLSVKYSIEIDLGGILPAWVVNSLSHKAPYETFKSMREKIGSYGKSKM